MLAFYGLLVINLGQQTQAYKGNIVQNLQQVDASIGSFSCITEPLFSSRFNWTVQSDREYNAYMILQNETWKNSPVEVLNPIVTSIVNNYTEAVKMDEEVRDWLTHLNVTHFPAHYNLVKSNLHDLVDLIYREFPRPPVRYYLWYIQSFVDSDFPDCETPFQRWAERYKLYYLGILDIRSRINEALQGIAQVYLDGAKLDSQTLETLMRENRTNDWLVTSFHDSIQYNIVMSTYYRSIFESLDNINSLTIKTLDTMNKYHQFYSLAFSDIWPPVVCMAFFGIIIPMTLLGLSDSFDALLTESLRLRSIYFRIYPWRDWILRLIVSISILGFTISTIFGINLVWRQISGLYLT